MLFVGLDVSVAETSVCIMDRDGGLVRDGLVRKHNKRARAGGAPGARGLDRGEHLRGRAAEGVGLEAGRLPQRRKQLLTQLATL